MAKKIAIAKNYFLDEDGNVCECRTNEVLLNSCMFLYTDDRYHGNAVSRDPLVQETETSFTMKLLQ